MHEETFVSRVGDFIVGHAKGLMVVLAIGGVVAVLALTASDEKAVAEDPSAPGYDMVRAMERDGEIESYKAIEPEERWTSEYSLNDGDAYIRFDGQGMEVQVDYGGGELEDAISDAAADAGYSDTP